MTITKRQEKMSYGKTVKKLSFLSLSKIMLDLDIHIP